MKVKPGFDRRNAGFYRWVLCGLALASALMLLADLLGKSAGGPGGWHAVAWPALALLVAAWGYAATRVAVFSFRWVGLAGAAFALAMYGFGMPTRLALLVGLSCLAAVVISLALAEKGDRQVEDDDPETRL